MFETINFQNPPVMLAAWPGMGNVGLIAMDYLRRKLEVRSFAEIDMGPFFIPESIIVKDGIAQMPDVPSSIFTFRNNPDIIIFESNAQIGGREGMTIISTILDMVRQFNVRRIFTAAAFSQNMSCKAPSEVLAACNIPELLKVIGEYGITPMPDGVIAGLNGLLLGVARSRQVEAACFLGTIPAYATNLAYPKASMEIIRIFTRMLRVEIDMAEMEQSVAEMDQQLTTIEERIRQFTGDAAGEDEELANLDQEKVPQFIMERIEKMFKRAERDRNCAQELKQELDRWKLFELYENRFLDLFEDDKGRK